MRKLFDFYLDASMHIGLAVSSLVVVTCSMLNISCSFSLLGFVLSATVVCYNFIKYGVEAEKYFIVSKSYHFKIQVFSFLAFIIAVWLFLDLNREAWWTVTVLGMISAFYAVPFLPKARNLRSLSGFKIYIVALVWAGFTVLLPVFQAQRVIDSDIALIFAQRFILVLVLMLPFEIRDVEKDDVSLSTIPQRIGVGGTKKLGLVLIGFFLILPYLNGNFSLSKWISTSVTALLLAWAILKSNGRESKYFTTFWVEAIPILWAILVVLLTEVLA